MSLVDQYTLVIPTYNRADQIATLLRYLDAERAPFCIRVLDSSRPDVRKANRRSIAATSLTVEYVEFSEETQPFDKFREGINNISTPFCGLCADDDIILVDGVKESVAFLGANPDFSVAHGYYFQFDLDSTALRIANITYYTPSYHMDEPLARLHALFRHYQALTYGTYRTEALARVFSTVRPIGSILARELLSSALATVYGKVARLPFLFHGRSLGPSSQYDNWHPFEWLIVDPVGLFREYGEYRRLLGSEVLKEKSNTFPKADIDRVIDLIHAQYLVRHAPDETFDHIVLETLKYTPPRDIFRSLPVTMGLVHAANGYSPNPGQPADDPGLPAPQSRSALHVVALAQQGGRAASSLLTRLKQRVIAMEPVAPNAVRQLRKLALMTGLAQRAAAPAMVAPVSVPASTPDARLDATSAAASPPPARLMRRTPVRTYLLEPAFLSPNPAWNVTVSEEAIDRLITALNNYQ